MLALLLDAIAGFVKSALPGAEILAVAPVLGVTLFMTLALDSVGCVILRRFGGFDISNAAAAVVAHHGLVSTATFFASTTLATTTGRELGCGVTATFLPVIARTALPGSAWLDLFWPIFGVGIVMGAVLATRIPGPSGPALAADGLPHPAGAGCVV